MTFAERILEQYRGQAVILCLPANYDGHDETMRGLLVSGGTDYLVVRETLQKPYERIVNAAHIQSVIPPSWKDK